jgi:acetoin utilization deacetylase AcuC-like enzyme
MIQVQTAFLADKISKLHDPGYGHPEQPARFDAAVRGVGEDRLIFSRERSLTPDQLALCHTKDYIQSVYADVAAGAPTLSTGDTDICPSSLTVALRAGGLCLNAVDMVMKGEARNAFCIVRPPGHHATPTRGMGFCLFNNIAIAARYAQDAYGVQRVLIADWDVHHGNGTQDIFYSDPSVFFFSTHQWPWYPGTGAADETGFGAGEGTTLNCPFEAGAGHDEILGVFGGELAEAMEGFRPDLVMVSAGFDSRAGDPLGRFLLRDRDFGELTSVLLEIADKHAGGRLISVLEGGYNLAGLESAVHAHAQALLNGYPK